MLVVVARVLSCCSNILPATCRLSVLRVVVSRVAQINAAAHRVNVHAYHLGLLTDFSHWMQNARFAAKPLAEISTPDFCIQCEMAWVCVCVVL